MNISSKGRNTLKEIDTLIEKVQQLFGENGRRDEFLKKERIQVKIGLGRSYIGKFLDYNMLDYFSNPETRIKGQLEGKLFLHRELPDDTVRIAEIGYDHGAAGAMENSLFGVETIFEKGGDPKSSQTPVINEPKDLAALKIPDFYSSGPMPSIHDTHEKIKTILDGRIPVTFPGWCRGTWSVACFVRGFTNIYMDLIDNPEFVKELLDFIAESRISWEKQRSEFTGLSPKDPENMYTNNYLDYRRVHVSDMYNDEVDGNIISPAAYEEIIFPSEKKLNDFYGGTRYYHSCGNLTPFLSKLTQLKELQMLHIGPWTDIEKAKEITHTMDIVLQLAVHPEGDIFNITEEAAYEKLLTFVSVLKGRNSWICADAIYSGDFNRIKSWLALAKKVVADMEEKRTS